jgi:hypothetical protein
VTANSRRASALLVLAVCAAAAAGCGGAAPRAATATGAAGSSPPSPFSWPAPGPAPAGWRVQRTPLGATLPYPGSWREVAGDSGTASAVLRDAAGGYLGYLNLTPRQGAESAASWSSFRPAHNRAEGDRDVRVLAAARDVRLRDGSGACVEDAYTTVTGIRYVELACLVSGARSAVVVGAAPPAQWHAQEPVIARAISAVTL